MKNIIIYYYDLNPQNIRINKNGTYFEDDKNKYLLKETKRTTEELYEIYDLSKLLYANNIFLHNIVLNKYGNIISEIDDKKYVMLHLKEYEKRKINLNDIIYFSNININKNYKYILRNEWKQMWSNKIDYIEMQIEENRHKHSEISMDIDYFIGLLENAIQLLENVKINELSIQHIRIKKNMFLTDLYDPLNIVLDSKVRDLCEFYKESIFDNDIVIDLNNINNNNFTKKEIYLFFVRFLYITIYFDIYENKILNNENISTNIDSIKNHIDLYEKKIKEFYNKYEYNILPEIDWIKKASK